nr:hypothetical protein BgiMline_024629 [Biomphalaria glabrata]
MSRIRQKKVRKPEEVLVVSHGGMRRAILGSPKKGRERKEAVAQGFLGKAGGDTAVPLQPGGHHKNAGPTAA